MRYAGTSAHVKDSRGMQFLARLLSQPNEPISAVALLADVAGDDRVRVGGSSGDVLDHEAKQAYKQRIMDLQEEIAELEEFNDTGRMEQATAELDAVIAELSRATGLGGRSREQSDAERFRKNVSNAVTRAIAKVEAAFPALGRHLQASVQCGRSLMYAPPELTAWATQ